MICHDDFPFQEVVLAVVMLPSVGCCYILLPLHFVFILLWLSWSFGVHVGVTATVVFVRGGGCIEPVNHHRTAGKHHRTQIVDRH